jgi:hypothetical protein
MLAALFAALLLGQVSALGLAPVPDVRQLAPPPATRLAEIDVAKVKGTPVGVAWREDGTIYLRVQDKEHTRHYLITTVPALAVGQVDQTPEWAAAYWHWKGAEAAPGEPTVKLEIERRQDRSRTVNLPSAGEMAGISSTAAIAAGGGGEMGVSDAAALGAVATGYQSTIVTMRFKGHVVGEWSNEVPQPGLRLGWAPAGMGLLAFVDARGQLVISDKEGRLLPFGGSSEVLLPAWSTDGKRLAYLQKQKPTVYDLMVADIR